MTAKSASVAGDAVRAIVCVEATTRAIGRAAVGLRTDAGPLETHAVGPARPAGGAPKTARVRGLLDQADAHVGFAATTALSAAQRRRIRRGGVRGTVVHEAGAVGGTVGLRSIVRCGFRPIIFGVGARERQLREIATAAAGLADGDEHRQRGRDDPEDAARHHLTKWPDRGRSVKAAPSSPSEAQRGREALRKNLPWRGDSALDAASFRSARPYRNNPKSFGFGLDFVSSRILLSTRSLRTSRALQNSSRLGSSTGRSRNRSRSSWSRNDRRCTSCSRDNRRRLRRSRQRNGPRKCRPTRRRSRCCMLACIRRPG
jgi:hypothetical protein